MSKRMKRAVLFVAAVLLAVGMMSTANAQIFCRGGQCRIGARLGRAMVAPIRRVQSRRSYAASSCEPAGYAAASCAPQEVQCVQSCCQTVQFVERRGLLQRFRDRRAARRSSRSCCQQVSYAAAPSCADYSGWSSESVVEAVDGGTQSSTWEGNDPPPAPVPALSPVVPMLATVERPNFRVM